MISKALLIAARAHAGQTDRDGEAAILHPVTVGLMGRTDEERVAGFLHDVLEDSDITPDDLRAEGIPESTVAALRLLTHEKGTDYWSYIQRIIDSGNPVALRVKYHDLQHNFERGKRYPDLQAKHGRALKMIKAAVERNERVERYDYESARGRGLEVAVFAAGCFWGVQHYFQRQPGVERAIVGYTGGQEEEPDYNAVRRHLTGHVEAVLVEYRPGETSYEDLCKLFFEIHDPAQTDGQGPDKGSQYRSALFFTSPGQEAVALRLIEFLRAKGHEVNTLLNEAMPFWIAEGYHQDYYAHSGGSPYCHVRVRKFR